MKYATISSVVALSLGVVSTKATPLPPAACGITQLFDKATTALTGTQWGSHGAVRFWHQAAPYTGSLYSTMWKPQTAITTLTEKDFLGPEYCNQTFPWEIGSGNSTVGFGTAIFKDWHLVKLPKNGMTVRLLYDRNNQSVNGYVCPTLTSANEECQHFWKNAVDTTVYAEKTWPKLEWTMNSGNPIIKAYNAEPVRKMILAADSNAYNVPVWAPPLINTRKLKAEVTKLNNEVSKLNTTCTKCDTEYTKLKTTVETIVSQIADLNTKVDTLMTISVVKNTLNSQETGNPANQNDAQVSEDYKLLKKENTKLKKEYLDSKIELVQIRDDM